MRKPCRLRPTASRPRPHTRKSPRRPRSYTSLSDALSQPLTFTDTELAEGIQRHSLAGLLAAAIRRRRRSDGEPLPNVLCALLVWPLLKVKSLHCFCAELCQILAGQVSVLYDFLGREDINWRGLASELAPRVIVLDVMLPGMDGWELLGRLREHPQLSAVPVIVCTILPQQQLALALGAGAFVRKPFSREAFLSVLDQQVGSPSRELR